MLEPALSQSPLWAVLANIPVIVGVYPLAHAMWIRMAVLIPYACLANSTIMHVLPSARGREETVDSDPRRRMLAGYVEDMDSQALKVGQISLHLVEPIAQLT